MGNNDSIRFDIIGNDQASGAFSRVGESAGTLSRKMDIAAKSSLVLDEALKRQQTASRASVDATLSLAKADDILTEAEHMLRDGALEAEYALKKETEAKKQSGDAALAAAAKNKAFKDSLNTKADSMKAGGGPSFLGPALLAAPLLGTLGGVGAGAALGLGGAAIAGGGALAAYAAVAKPILTSTLTAAQAVNAAQSTYQSTIAAGVPKAQAQLALQTANKNAQLTYNAALAGGANPAKALAAYHLALAKNQNTYNAATSSGTFNAKAYAAEQAAIGKAYANLSPAQIQLSKQLGDMSNAWQNVKASFTPLVASSLQPWLQGITTAIGSLGSILKPMAPVVHDLGVQFATLMDSSTFKDFMSWIGKTGAIVDKSVGNAVMDFLTAMTFLLPQFTPLIKGAAAELTKWADAFVKWSASQKAADGITKFLAWFHQNGPVVGQLLKNIGLALKALAPGIGTASVAELNVISGFFAWVAKLPPGLARPLAEVIGTLLILNKLGVVSAGVKLVGMTGLGGKAAEGAAAGGWWSKLLPGAVMTAGGYLAIGLVIGASIKAAGDTLAPKGSQAGNVSQALQTSKGNTESIMPGIFGGFEGQAVVALAPVFKTLQNFRHEVSAIFAGIRSDVANIWNSLWNNTIGRGQRGLQDSDHYLGIFRHNTATFFDQTRHDAASIWDSAWNWITSRTARGQHDHSSWMNLLWRDSNSKLSGIRHDAASIWDSAWNNTVSRTSRGVHDVGSWLTAMWRNHNSILSGLRSNAASTWNAIWNSTVTRTWQGVTGVMNWIGTLPGRIVNVFRGAGSWLWNVGVWVIDGLWNGAKSQVGGITGFFSSFASGIVGVFKKIWGWFSPSSVMYEGGKSLMQGLMGGIKDHAHQAVAAATAAATKVAAASGSAAAAQRYAAGVLGRFGWGQDQMGSLISLWNQESGWNANAVNPSSGAYGIPQALPAAQGHPYNLGDYANQIMWGLNYIKGRYGSPNAAWGHEQGFNWYGSGTLSAAPGWAVVGEHGPELMHFRGGEQVVPAGAGRGGSTYVINVSPSPLARPADIGREIVGAIKEHEKRAGKGWRVP